MELVVCGYVLSIFLSISLFFNIIFFQKIRFLKKTPPPQLTKDAQMLLAELASGSAVLKINVIDPADILIRSPRS